MRPRRIRVPFLGTAGARRSRVAALRERVADLEVAVAEEMVLARSLDAHLDDLGTRLVPLVEARLSARRRPPS